MDQVMSLILCIVVHLLVILSVAGMAYFVFYLVKDEDDVTERLLRSAAAGAGLLAYTAAKAYGLSLPATLSSSLEVTRPLSIGLWGGLLPSMGGTFVSWFALRLMHKDDDVGKRGLVLFTTFVFTMFADSYATLAGEMKPNAFQFALPNISFVLGCVIYLLFCYKRKPSSTSATDARPVESTRRDETVSKQSDHDLAANKENEHEIEEDESDDRFLYTYQVELLKTGTRDEIIEWLVWSGPDGKMILDEEAHSLGFNVKTLEKARDLMRYRMEKMKQSRRKKGSAQAPASNH